jgi:hypothetical protein
MFVVPVGELERWAPEVPDHGPGWVAQALEQKTHEREGPHVQFVLDLAKSV